jgi:hypothetical protein
MAGRQPEKRSRKVSSFAPILANLLRTAGRRHGQEDT